MISRCGLLKKKKDMSVEHFRDFWFNDHGPIACRMEKLRRYQQHLVIDRLQTGKVDLDAYSELYFDDIYTMEQGVASLHGAGTEDLKNFVEECKLLIFAKKWDRMLPAEFESKKLVKCVSLLSRPDTASAGEFQKQFWQQRSADVAGLGGQLAYAQNMVIDRLFNGQHIPYDELPVDGMEEFWFEDMDSCKAFLCSAEYSASAARCPACYGSISTYIIETAEYPIFKH